MEARATINQDLDLIKSCIEVTRVAARRAVVRDKDGREREVIAFLMLLDNAGWKVETGAELFRLRFDVWFSIRARLVIYVCCVWLYYIISFFKTLQIKFVYYSYNS